MPLPDVATLYRGLSTTSLRELQAAFQLEDAAPLDAPGRVFVQDRLRLIAAELRARSLTEPPLPLEEP